MLKSPKEDEMDYYIIPVNGAVLCPIASTCEQVVCDNRTTYVACKYFNMSVPRFSGDELKEMRLGLETRLIRQTNAYATFPGRR